MRILLLGGTGAMGVSLKKILAERGDEVFISSRTTHDSENNIHYLLGNAHDDQFLSDILKSRYDAIVDFMIYQSGEFETRVNKLLDSTDHYIFTSSSRVYANSEVPITEDSPRLLDASKDIEYLKTDEYALAKAREENTLFRLKRRNWTIIRPYITYNVERLQLGGIEKDVWLYRAMHGRSIPLPKNIADCQTTMTYGGDVAAAIALLIGNKNALGEAFHLTGTEHMAWSEILKIYLDVLEKETNIETKIYMPEDSIKLCEIMGSKYQIEYDRLYNREFDNSKLLTVCGNNLSFISMKNGLSMCISEFIQNPRWNTGFNAKLEAYLNREANEKISLRELCGTKTKMKYLGWRYMPQILETIKRIR